MGGDLNFSWHLARTPLEAVFGHHLSKLFRKYPQLLVDNHQYRPGGQDQIHFTVDDLALAQQLLDDETILQAMRLFNYRLVKKGPCVYSRNHCLALADRLVD